LIVGFKELGLPPTDQWWAPPGFMFEDDAVIARVTFTNPDDAMNMANGPLVEECLNEWDFLGITPYIVPPSVTDRLSRLLDHVEEVIARLEPFLS
jgi:hypothetical protein